MQGYDVPWNSADIPLIFLMIDSTDHITGKPGLTPTVTISKNGGSFATPSGAVTGIANGWYKAAGNATDTNTLGPIILHATATGADDADAIYPVVANNPQLPLFVRSGTAQSGSTSVIRLDSGASATDDFYSRTLIYIYSGTGANQARNITSYNGTTKDANVDYPFLTAPDNTSKFIILPTDSSISGTVNANLISVDGLTTADGSAILNLKRFNITNNTSDPAFHITNSAGHAIKSNSTGSGGSGMSLDGDWANGGSGLTCQGKNGIYITGANTDCVGLRISGGGSSGPTTLPYGAGIYLDASDYSPSLYIQSSYTQGEAISIQGIDGISPTILIGSVGGGLMKGVVTLDGGGGGGVGAGGDGISITSSGTGKHDIKLAGSGDIYDSINSRLISVFGVDALNTILTSGTYGNSALLSAINNINNLSALANLFGPSDLVKPASSSILYPFTFVVKDAEGHLVDVDTNAVTLTAANAAGTDRSANLSSVTHAGTGQYTFTYSVASTATDEGLAITASGTVASATRKAFFSASITDPQSSASLAAIQAQTDKLTFDGSNNVAVIKTGYKLASDGLASIDPTVPSGMPTTWPARMMQLWWSRLGRNRKTPTSSPKKIEMLDTSNTVIATQNYTDDGAGTETISEVS
jgi:hypothetical protein